MKKLIILIAIIFATSFSQAFSQYNHENSFFSDDAEILQYVKEASIYFPDSLLNKKFYIIDRFKRVVKEPSKDIFFGIMPLELEQDTNRYYLILKDSKNNNKILIGVNKRKYNYIEKHEKNKKTIAFLKTRGLFNNMASPVVFIDNDYNKKEFELRFLRYKIYNR